MADSEVLSQDEIDALLTGVSSGDIDEVGDDETLAEEGEVQPYDFTSQDRIVRGRMPTLEMINQRAARNLRHSVHRLLRKVPTVTPEGVRVTKFGEYLHTLLSPSNLNIVRVNPLKGSALVVCTPSFIFALVDCFFGGAGKAFNKVQDRELTTTEMRVVRNFLQSLFADFTDAWSQVIDLEFEYLNSESNPQFAHIVTSGELVVVSSFNVDLDGASGDIHLTMPYSMIEPVREALDADLQGEAAERDERWSEVLHEEVKGAKVELRAKLTETRLSISRVAGFRAGDVFPVELPDTVIATVGDVPVFRAGFGMSHGHAALKVIEPIRHDQLLSGPSRSGESQ